MNRAFEQQVIVPLERQRRRLRFYRAVEGVFLACATVVGLFAAQLVLDYFLRFRRDTRAVLLVLILAATGYALWRFLIRPLSRRFDAFDLAGEVQRRFGGDDALLVSAMEFHAGHVGPKAGNSPALVDSVIARAANEARDLPFDDLVDGSRARRFGWGMAGIGLALVASLIVVPATLGTWFDRNILLSDVSWPKRTLLIVETDDDGVIRAAVGDDVEIRASVDPQYEVPRQVDILFVTDSDKKGRETMTGVGQRGFRSSFSRVREPFRFQLRGGDDITRWYEVELSERPRVDEAVLTVTPPSYTRLDMVRLAEGQRSAEMYRGSTLTMQIRCNKTITSARVMSGGKVVTDAIPADDGTWIAEVQPAETSTYYFDLVDDIGFRNVNPVRFSARIVQDHTPKVKLSIPDVGNLVTLNAVLGIEAEFTDDLGLAEAGVFYRVSDADETSIELDGFAPYRTLFSAQTNWNVAAADAEIGSQVSIFARASDYDIVSGPNERESAAVTFRIATVEELQAEFARREQEYRRQFERLMQSQERIRRELLSLLARVNEPQTNADLELLLAPMERRQRQLNAQVNLIRRQFEQLVSELRINQLATNETQKRLVDSIITPMSQLAVKELTDGADLLRRLGREKTDVLAAAVDPLQARILARMQIILDNMLKWEGYQETVNMLREILQLQRELRDETRDEIDRAGGDVFDD